MIKKIKINKKEAALLALIESGGLGECCWLMDEAEVKTVLETGLFGSHFMPMPQCFSPCEELNGSLSGAKFASTLALICDGEIVGEILDAKSFANDRRYNNIFNTRACYALGELNPCISGQIRMKNNHFSVVRSKLLRRIKATNARKITALLLSADPITRAHERMLRWSIDKADLVVVFITEGSGVGSLDYELKQRVFDEYAREFLPLERIFVVHLRHIDLFAPFCDPNYGLLIAKNFGAHKFVIGQNHSGIGLFYSQQHAHTAIDTLCANSGLELIVLPEMVFCTQCKVMVSTKSCPHGAHLHIRYRSQAIRAMLHAGIIPPAILVRKEVSSKLLAALHPHRLREVGKLYNALFPSDGLIEERSDEQIYRDLMRLYQTTSLV